MAKKKVIPVDNYKPPPDIWFIYIRKQGFLQPIPYKYKIPDIKSLKEYAQKR